MTGKVIDQLIPAVAEASAEILEVYNSDFAIDRKEDKSPLTAADRRSHLIISEFLKKNFPYPVLSEEGKNIPHQERKEWKQYWLIDPLDGTKEFINRNGDFTINVALIRERRPILGLIYAPVSGVLYYANHGEGAFKVENGRKEKLPLSGNSGCFTVAGSRSHGSPEFDLYVEEMKREHGSVQLISRGSSLKFCLVAEGIADVYPRLGPTMEWDTAAGQIIVEEAGGKVLELMQTAESSRESRLSRLRKDRMEAVEKTKGSILVGQNPAVSARYALSQEFKTNRTLVYNKECLTNPYFVATR